MKSVSRHLFRICLLFLLYSFEYKSKINKIRRFLENHYDSDDFSLNFDKDKKSIKKTENIRNKVKEEKQSDFDAIS